MPTPEENRELARRFMEEVFNNKNLDYAEEWMDDGFIEHSPQAPDIPPDKKGTLESFRMMFAASPDMKAEVLDLIASGNKVAIRGRFSGTDQGGFMPGTPATGKPFSMEGIDVVTLTDDGRLSEHYGVVDVMGAMGQLGLLPPSPGA